MQRQRTRSPSNQRLGLAWAVRSLCIALSTGGASRRAPRARPIASCQRLRAECALAAHGRVRILLLAMLLGTGLLALGAPWAAVLLFPTPIVI
jgi:hypothetical protein